MIIADTSGLLALFNNAESQHSAVARCLQSGDETIVASPFVVAELDYLVATRLGVNAELSMLRELAGGAYEIANLSPADLDACAAVVHKYADQEIGVTDGSLVVLANRHRTRSILTLDRRHFGVVRPLDGGRFKLLPDR